MDTDVFSFMVNASLLESDIAYFSYMKTTYLFNQSELESWTE